MLKQNTISVCYSPAGVSRLQIRSDTGRLYVISNMKKLNLGEFHEMIALLAFPNASFYREGVRVISHPENKASPGEMAAFRQIVRKLERVARGED